MKKIVKEIQNHSVIHGRVICNEVLKANNRKLPPVRISDNVYPVTVLDRPGYNNCTLKSLKFIEGEIKMLFVDKYKKWISKIETLSNFIEENYKKLPEYILYIDGIDTLILKDIKGIPSLLDRYGCKVLFNHEPAFWGTGNPQPGNIPGYYDKLFYDVKSEYVNKLNSKFSFTKKLEFSLNAGAFVGEKNYVLGLLNETLQYMEDSTDKGFPYGCQDDQLILKYLHNKYFDDISIDIYNEFFFWGAKQTLEENDKYFEPNCIKKHFTK